MFEKSSSWAVLAAITAWATFGIMHFAAAQTDSAATKASASDLARGRYIDRALTDLGA